MITAKLPCDIFTGFVLKQNDKGITIRQYYMPYDIIVDHVQSAMQYNEIAFIVKSKIFKVGYNLLYNPFITTKSYKRSMMCYGLSKDDKAKQYYSCDEFLTHAECNCDFEKPIVPQGCNYYTFAGTFYYHEIEVPKNIEHVDRSKAVDAVRIEGSICGHYYEYYHDGVY